MALSPLFFVLHARAIYPFFILLIFLEFSRPIPPPSHIFLDYPGECSCLWFGMAEASGTWNKLVSFSEEVGRFGGGDSPQSGDEDEALELNLSLVERMVSDKQGRA